MRLVNIGTLFTGHEFLHNVENLTLNPSPPSGERLIDCQGGVVIPGFVDCHTHLVFAGSRANEFEMRSKGMTYAQIMQAGGGILNTVRATRSTSKQELIDLALPRLERMQKRGVVAVEIKTGYGLSLDSELKMLEVIDELRKLQPVELEATFLGAHAVPPEFKPDHYIEHIIQDMLPAVKSQGIASACDIFVERGAFSIEQARRILSKARDLGLRTRVHAEQLSHTGACQLAAEMGALSASHLEFATPEDAKALAGAGIIAELLPTAQEYLGLKQQASGRMLTDAGCKVAIGTDFNPGSDMCDDLLLAARLGVTKGGLTCEEALKGITSYAGLALGRPDLGVLQVGSKASFQILKTPNWVDLFYDWSGC